MQALEPCGKTEAQENIPSCSTIDLHCFSDTGVQVTNGVVTVLQTSDNAKEISLTKGKIHFI